MAPVLDSVQLTVSARLCEMTLAMAGELGGEPAAYDAVATSGAPTSANATAAPARFNVRAVNIGDCLLWHRVGPRAERRSTQLFSEVKRQVAAPAPCRTRRSDRLSEPLGQPVVAGGDSR